MGLLGKHPGLRDTLVVQLTPPLPSFTLRPNKDHRRSASAQGSGIHPPSLNAVQASKQNRERERQRARQRARARETDRERVREIEGGEGLRALIFGGDQAACKSLQVAAHARQAGRHQPRQIESMQFEGML